MIITSEKIHLSLNHIDVGYLNAKGHWDIVIQDLSLQLKRGQIGCLLGPSGCGKSTVLRAICGFEPVQSGEIVLDGQTVSTSSHTITPEKRKVGVVFQDYALFPHLTVSQNVAFGLRRHSKEQAKLIAHDWLARVGLPDLGSRYPHELSGGQQQRVALARALAPEPDLLLLDEPFSNLDVDLRERLASEVRDILKANKTTALLVTHDQFEAFAIADDIGVMLDGQLMQWDTAYNLYHQPKTKFIANFIGHSVFVPGKVLSQNTVALELGSLALPENHIHQLGETIDVLLRADDVVHDDLSPLQAMVVNKAFRGGEFLYTLQTEGQQKLFAMVPSHHNHEIGEKIGIKLVADHVVTFTK